MSASDPPKPQRAQGAREFVLDTVVVAVTQVLLKLRALITLPLIVKLLGTASYGIWAQALAFLTLCTAILGINLHLPLVRFVAAEPRRAGTVFSSLLVTTLVIGVVGGGLIAGIAPWLSATFMDASGQERYLQYGVLLVLAGNVRQLNVNVYRATGRLLIRSLVELVAALVEVAGIMVVLLVSHSLLMVFVFMAVWGGVVALATTIHVFGIVRLARPALSIAREALAYSVPILPAALSFWALDRADRFIIGTFMGLEGVGIYSANYAFASTVLLFQLPFQMTLLPKVASLWELDRPLAARYIGASLRVFLTFAIPFAAGIPLLGPYLLHALGNAAIARLSGPTTLLLTSGSLLWGLACTQFQVFYGARKTGAIAPITIVTALLKVVLTFLLVPAMGVLGAAVATLVAYACTAIISGIMADRLLRVPYEGRYLFKCLVSSGVMAAFLWIVAPASPLGVTLAATGAVLIYFGVLFALRGFTGKDLVAARVFVARILRR